MCRYVLLIFFYLFLFRNLIDGGKINKSTKNLQVNQSTDESFKYTEPILLNSANVDLEKELNDAIDDNHSRFPDSNDNQRQVVDIENRLLEQEAAKDDAQVPSSFDNSLLHKSDDENSDFLTLSMNSLLEIDEETNYFSLDRVTPGTIPPGITQQDYSSFDELKLIHLYQSNKSEDTKRLLNYIAQHIHNKYANCLSNFVKWILNPFSNEPIFYRNCVPCANAVDLNLQSLFDQHTNQSKLKHYFVNTCNMEKQWISYISNMKYLTVDLKQHPNTSFTDVIRQNLLPNHRYVIQAIVQSTYPTNRRAFLHASNLINDECGHIWIIDGQIQTIFDLNQTDHIKQLDQRYRPDYVARASTGLFRAPTFTLV